MGLSDVVVLAEADLNSGTMRSAEFALKSGKELFVFSHRMEESLGTQKLLQEGKAKAIYNIESFLDSLGLHKKAAIEKDELLAYSADQPLYDDAVARFKEKPFEYELLGKVKIVNGRVIVA